MLTIRLQRTGKRNQADFRIVLAEKQSPVKKKFVEVLGSYNPRKKYFQAKEERIKYWIAQRVEISPTVHNLFIGKGLAQGQKVKAFSIPKNPPAGGEEKAPAAPAAEAPTPAEIKPQAADTAAANPAETSQPVSEPLPAEQPKA